MPDGAAVGYWSAGSAVVVAEGFVGSFYKEREIHLLTKGNVLILSKKNSLMEMIDNKITYLLH